MIFLLRYLKLSYNKTTEKKYQQPRPSTGMKPKGFKPVKKKPEESLGSQIGEAESQESARGKFDVCTN